MTKPKSKKKSEKPKEASTPTESKVNVPTESPVGQTPPSAPPSGKVAPKSWFTAEIQLMMYTFGDHRRPLQSSAALIEEVVHSQMTSLLHQAAEVTIQRGARFIGVEDIIFIMRRDKKKLRRLLRYLDFKDLKQKVVKGSGLEEGGEVEVEDIKQPVAKRRKLCYDFLSAIDQTGELLSLFEDDEIDEVKQERAERADMQTRSMDQTQYMEYVEARQTTFHKKASKFRDWMDLGTLEVKPNPLAMEILSYLAYETVGTIVDCALLIKKDTERTVNNPLQPCAPHLCSAPDTISVAPPPPLQIKSPSSRPSSPNQTPPSTPTTPTGQSGNVTPLMFGSQFTAPPSSATQNSNSAGLTLPTTPQTSIFNFSSNSGGSGKSKKKKKKSGSSAPEPASADAIQPSHVREVMRRYGANIGPMAPFAAYNKLPAPTFLAC
ncbi:PREDICTED: transcription initiation protein SPT3 homolog isoform X1 [Branchiostoma belcheri]|uniref:Transcription initiation protein SPT3 homolog isoform X1 n=2 Tax=Branchiostoma belcheri TaxID=7741 RepID=A0A6P4Z155_BRABE|nr:PREDICTED: transcription initiation protein SPT3 homolog isoform X1 [Branchiostoma belcheri]